MPKLKTKGACPAVVTDSGAYPSSPSDSSSLTNEPLMSEPLKDEFMTQEPTTKEHVRKEQFRKEHVEQARRHFSAQVESKPVGGNKAASDGSPSMFNALHATPARRRLLIAVAVGGGGSLLLTIIAVVTFIFSALGAIGLMLSILACGLVMCVFTCAFFSFFCGLGISIFVGVSIGAAMLSFQLCMSSVDAMQSAIRCASGG